MASLRRPGTPARSVAAGAARARTLRLALAQVAPALGDIEANVRLHLRTAREAARAGADLVVFPELSLTGYRLQDLVSEVAVPIDPRGPLRPLFEASRRIGLVIGLVEESEGHRFYNSAAYLEGGRVRHVHRKAYLPTYGMFEEGRYFAPGDAFGAFRARAGRLGMLICEDLWHPASALVLAQDGADLLLVLANGPTQTIGSGSGPRNRDTWRELVKVTARMQTVFVALVNRVGVEDGINFFGGSVLVDPLGRVAAEGATLGEDLVIGEVDRSVLRRARTEYPLLRDERLALLEREMRRLLSVPDRNRGPGGT